MGSSKMKEATTLQRTLQSLRFGTRARDDGVGRVLYWSPRAVALLFHHRVITLLNRNGVLLPSAVIVDIDKFPHITSGYFNEDQIILDAMIIELSHPIDLSLRRTSSPPIEETLDSIRPYLKIKSHSISSAVLRLEGELNNLSGIEKTVSDKQFKILMNSQSPDIAIQHLLGLGFGLTPSGDDFTLGVISIFNILGENTHKIREAVMAYDYPLSKTMLLDALDYHYSEPVYNLIKSLSDGIPTKIVLSNLVNVGHSSGSDILAGVYYSLSSLSNRLPTMNVTECQTIDVS